MKEAEGKADALLKIKTAEAEGIKILKDSNPDQKIITLKSLETLSDVANGQATKIIVPSDLQNIATIGTTIKEMIKDEK
jgi:regulator of protease activity HflC (stomatin/prohibitin superfamily)